MALSLKKGKTQHWPEERVLPRPGGNKKKNFTEGLRGSFSDPIVRIGDRSKGDEIGTPDGLLKEGGH